MTDLIKCPECGEYFNPAYLDQVALHLHDGVLIDETIKGERLQEFTSIEQYELKDRGTVYIVQNDRDRQRDDMGLLGEEVLIDGVVFKIKGVESYLLQEIVKGQLIGLLV